MTFPRRSPIVSLLAVALTTPVGCSFTDAEEEPVVKIAFFQDLSVPDHVDLVSPSFLAFDMVVQRRVADARGVAVEVEQLDTGGDSAAAIEMAREVAADPAFVMAVAAPFWREPPEVARILAEAGVPTMSLSPMSASPWMSAAALQGDPAELWRRLVPDQSAEAALLADIAGPGSPEGSPAPVCLVRDGTDYSSGLVASIETGLGPWPLTVVDSIDPTAAAAEVASSGCRVVVWGGFPSGALELAQAMREAGSASGRPVDLAGDALKTTVPPTSPVGDGVVVGSVACPCVDVLVDLDLASRRFVNAYQSEHGLTPGVYAAEAWDAGGIVADAMTSGEFQRDDMRAAFRALTTYEGIARTYTFDADGELLGARAGLFMAAGTRWLPLPA